MTANIAINATKPKKLTNPSLFKIPGFGKADGKQFSKNEVNAPEIV